MTDNARKQEQVKSEIRALLLSSPKGVYMHQLCRDYKNLVGQEMPIRELGYASVEDFVKNFPDVIRIEWVPHMNDFLLKAIADETTKHIEKLVAKQKSSKTGYPQQSKSGYSNPNRYKPLMTNIPPRFQPLYSARPINSMKPCIPASVRTEIKSLLKQYPDGLTLSNLLIAFEKQYGKQLSFQNFGFHTLEACLQTLPELFVRTKNNEIRVYITGNGPNVNFPSNTQYKGSEMERFKSSESVKLPVKVKTSSVPTQKVTNSEEPVKSLGNKVSPHEETGGEKPVKMKASGSIPKVDGNEFCSKETNGWLFSKGPSNWLPQKSVTCDLPTTVNNSSVGKPIVKTMQKKMDSLDDFSPITSENDVLENCDINKKMKDNFRKVLKRHPNGIWAAEFPDSYESITGHRLDLAEIGYFSLIELVDALPEVFVSKRPNGCKGDWMLFDAEALNEDSTVTDLKVRAIIFQNLTSNIRKILEGYPEGVFVDEFENVYNINCKEELNVDEYGFECIETLLLTLSERVPLKLKFTNGKMVVLLNVREDTNVQIPASDFLSPNIPPEVDLDAEYSWQTVPSEADIKEYIPVYVSTVKDPSHIWIQLRRDDTTISLEKLMDSLEHFYYGPHSKDYIIPDSHIIIGRVCAGVWPPDRNWHRVQITGIPSVDYVDVSFVDYGTRGKVSKTELRFLKKEYLSLPAQAIKARLACITPFQSIRWSKQSYDRLLALCKNKPLMAYITSTTYRKCLSVCLCDTSGSDDVHINDVLVKEGFAEYCADSEDNEDIPNLYPPIPKPVQPHFNPNMYIPQQLKNPQPAPDIGNIISQLQLLQKLSTLAQIQAAVSPLNNDSMLNSLLSLLNHGGEINRSNFASSQQFPPPNSDVDVLARLLANMTTNPVAVNNFGATQSANMPSMYPNQCYQGPSVPNRMESFAPSTSVFNPLNSSNAHLIQNHSETGSSNTFETRLAVTTPLSFSAAGHDFGNPSSLAGHSSQQMHEMEKLGGCNKDYTELHSSDSGEIFDDDDDDELFEKVCENIDIDTLKKRYAKQSEVRESKNSMKKRYVKRIKLKDGYRIHIILMDNKPYVSSGDISSLFWSNEGTDFLHRRLRYKEIGFPTITLSESDNEQLFSQLNKFKVKGIKGEDISKPVITLYPLKSVVDILNIFGHPSSTIRSEVEVEIQNFNPQHSLWKEFMDESVEEECEEIICETDNDKMKKLCLDDLKVTLHTLQYKRLKIMNALNTTNDVSNPVDELDKIETQCETITNRIKELQSRIVSYTQEPSVINDSKEKSISTPSKVKC